jgi:hypothetical protein
MIQATVSSYAHSLFLKKSYVDFVVHLLRSSPYVLHALAFAYHFPLPYLHYVPSLNLTTISLSPSPQLELRSSGLTHGAHLGQVRHAGLRVHAMECHLWLAAPLVSTSPLHLTLALASLPQVGVRHPRIRRPTNYPR